MEDNYVALRIYQNTLEKTFGFSWGDFIESLPNDSIEVISKVFGYLSEELVRLDSTDPIENLDCITGVIEELLWTSDTTDQAYWLGRIYQHFQDNSPKRLRK